MIGIQNIGDRDFKRVSLQLVLLSVVANFTYAQNDQSISLNIGDAAPALRVGAWIKGAPVKGFEKGQVYVLEFWATWCKPCIAGMPHLSSLAREYNDKVTILAIDIYEWQIKSPKSISKVKAFVDSMGNRMDFYVAAEDSAFTVADWIDATGEKNKGIPRTFVVDAEGKLGWIGYPKDLDEVLPKILNKTWNIDQALANRNLNRYLAQLDDSLRFELMRYDRDSFKPGSYDKPDSTLLLIDEIISKEPKLKYAPWVAFKTFSCLLQTNPNKAYEYGRLAIVTRTYDDPPYDFIIDDINLYSHELSLPAKIYELGAEAYQAQIDHYPYPELVDLSKPYYKMAEWYWRANNKSKAIEAQQNAIEALKNKKGFSVADMATFKSRLQQYKNL
jgi:thiol-disulfide isomerase/thioredoxin